MGIRNSDRGKMLAQALPEQGGGSADDAAPATIRKGVYLSALIYVEGDQAPADDFVAAAKAALSEALSTKTSSGYTITLKKAQAQNDVEQDDSGGSDAAVPAGTGKSKARGKGKAKQKSNFEF